MEKQKAIEKLKQQIKLIKPLKQKKIFSPDYKEWRRDTEVCIKNIFIGDMDSHLRHLTAIQYKPIRLSVINNATECQASYIEGLETAEAVLNSMIKEIEEWGIDKNNQPSLDAIAIIENLCERFHLVVKQLKVRHDNRKILAVEDEYDVQYLLHSLLTLHFDDIRPEEWTPSCAGSCSRVDFLLKQEQIVIEVKKTRKTLDAKKIREQLIIDITKYKAHPDCKKLLCFVYDPEAWIKNPRGLENDLNEKDGKLPVRVIITPK